MELTTGNVDMHFANVTIEANSAGHDIFQHTHITKRISHQYTPMPIHYPTVPASNQQAISRNLEPSYITNGQTCNADLRRLRFLPGP